MDEEDAKAAVEKFLRSLDLKKELLHIAFGGFDTYEDYEKYGDLFVPFIPPQKE